MNFRSGAPFLISFACLLFAGAAAAQSMITVQGHAQVDVVPDVFPIHIEIKRRSENAAEARDFVEVGMADILAGAKAMGLEDKDIELSNLEVEAVTRYDKSSSKDVFLGNDYSRDVVLRFHSLADLKSMLGRLPAGKELEIQTLRFELSGEREVRKKLFSAAIDDARQSAEIIAASIGAKLGPVHLISDQPIGPRVGASLNPIDISSVESSTILTREQISRIPVGRNITTTYLLAPGASKTDIVLNQGVVPMRAEVYVMYELAAP